MIKKSIGYSVIIILFLLVTFFGLGPVLYADGSSQERLITFLAVLFLYIILSILFYFWRKIFKAKGIKAKNK